MGAIVCKRIPHKGITYLQISYLFPQNLFSFLKKYFLKNIHIIYVTG
jgi:hypothetical protein